MRAVVVEAPGICSLQETALPEPGPGQVRIRLNGSGICASDLHVWEGRPWFEYPLPPGRPGHEGWGVIDALGGGVTGLHVGDRVATLSTCAYAEYATGDAEEVVNLPRALGDKPFPAEPLACAMNAIKRCAIISGETVAIVGAGFQGLLLLQLATGLGARVVVLSRRRSVLNLAEGLGAAGGVLMDDHWRAVAAAMELTGGEGYDCVIESTGHQWPLDLAAELTRIRGRLIIVGYHQDPRQVNMQQWNWRGLDVVNAHERDPRRYVQGLREAVRAVCRGQLLVDPLITHHYPLGDMAQAFADATSRPDGFLKAVMVMP